MGIYAPLTRLPEAHRQKEAPELPEAVPQLVRYYAVPPADSNGGFAPKPPESSSKVWRSGGRLIFVNGASVTKWDFVTDSTIDKYHLV